MLDIELLPTGPVNLRWNDGTEAEPVWRREARVLGADLSDLPTDERTAIEAHWSDPDVSAAWQALNPPAVPPTLSDLKQAKNDAVTAKREAVFAGGYTPASGPLAGHTLQVRNLEDRTNWQTSAISYQSAVAAGYGAQPGATFRTADNETVILTYMEGLTVIVQGMAQWGEAIMQRSWELKDQIDAAADEVALDAIDIDTGWPT